MMSRSGSPSLLMHNNGAVNNRSFLSSSPSLGVGHTNSRSLVHSMEPMNQQYAMSQQYGFFSQGDGRDGRDGRVPIYNAAGRGSRTMMPHAPDSRLLLPPGSAPPILQAGYLPVPSLQQQVPLLMSPPAPAMTSFQRHDGGSGLLSFAAKSGIMLTLDPVTSNRTAKERNANRACVPDGRPTSVPLSVKMTRELDGARSSKDLKTAVQQITTPLGFTVNIVRTDTHSGAVTMSCGKYVAPHKRTQPNQKSVDSECHCPWKVIYTPTFDEDGVEFWVATSGCADHKNHVLAHLSKIQLLATPGYQSISDHQSRQIDKCLEAKFSPEQIIRFLAADSELDGEEHMLTPDYVRGVLKYRKGDAVEDCTALLEHLRVRKERSSDLHFDVEKESGTNRVKRLFAVMPGAKDILGLDKGGGNRKGVITFDTTFNTNKYFLRAAACAVRWGRRIRCFENPRLLFLRVGVLGRF